MVGEHGTERPGDILGRQLGTGDLVQQRLELQIVVLIDQQHVHALAAQFRRAGHAGHPTANNHNLGHCASPIACEPRTL